MTQSRRFLLHYLLWVAVLFLLFYLDTNPLSHWINETQRQWLLEALRFFLGEERIRGLDILAHPHFRIIITQACNGLIPYYLYLAAILAYPRPWRDRLLWALLGYLVISGINVLRLLMVTAIVAGNPASFHWSHDILGNALLMVAGLGLFYLFLRMSRPTA
jgi:exosortase/archaeosortase family protein